MAEHGNPSVPIPVSKPLRETLRRWPQWSSKLQSEPHLKGSLNSGLSHQTYLVGNDETLFAVRIENHGSRALAMTREQEIFLMGLVDNLAPGIVWADSASLVTAYIEGEPWQPIQNLDVLCQSLHQLHSQNCELPSFDLLRHCDRYWDSVIQSSGKQLPPDSIRLFAQARHALVKILDEHPDQCLCHNDLNPDNILYRNSTFYFLDWEYACYNSPYFELASLAEFFNLSEKQTQLLSNTYWSNSGLKSLKTKSETSHHNSLKLFRFVVRFTEWLWLTLKQPEYVDKCEKRLKNLLNALQD
ncbi:phosphotransferase [Aestuariicella hydrocarbonica]|uniref:Phosphotransferase n=1 Tax=Pseudomaricurvus hydrocarbonicus TaxID=1470433 RepID=A0A9E5JTB1_9GAMM|nr:phosphotransferase [Aestuariicella hydrocarbonica]NHO66423.1 phosphotransferase [Aestuariicella hydrocarbonica]